jgi:uncharacterized membrane protein YidH (DUF202 family)
MTTVGGSLAVIAIGAILAFALNFSGGPVDIKLVGWILIIVGLIGLVYGSIRFMAARRAAERGRPIDPTTIE